MTSSNDIKFYFIQKLFFFFLHVVILSDEKFMKMNLPYSFIYIRSLTLQI